MPVQSAIDHIAAAVPTLDGTYEWLRAHFGCGRIGWSRSDRTDMSSFQTMWAAGARLELLAPSATPEPSFVDHFLRRFGSGIHHITLKVDDLDVAVMQLAEESVAVVDIDISRADWHEAFISPRTTGGPIVQIARSTHDVATASAALGQAVEDPTDDVEALHGVVLSHPDLSAAATLWTTLGAEVTEGPDGLMCTWDGCPLSVWIRHHGPTGLVVGDQAAVSLQQLLPDVSEKD